MLLQMVPFELKKNIQFEATGIQIPVYTTT